MVRPTASLSNATCGCLTLTNPVGIYLGSHLVVYERASTASKATLLCTVIVSNHTGLTAGICPTDGCQTHLPEQVKVLFGELTWPQTYMTYRHLVNVYAVTSIHQIT